jgi:predicted dehydrogenase
VNGGPVRLGYVGAGNLAQRVHLPNFASLEGCELVGLAEVRRNLGETVRQRFGIARLYADHRELAADTDVEAIAVSAPFAVQGEIARDCLAAGKHVFMEKPMAVSVAQADRLLAAEREGGGRLMVGYMKRYDAGNELAKGVIATWRESGEMGRLRYVRAHGFTGDWVAGLDVEVTETDEAPPAAPTAQQLPDWLPAGMGGKYLGYLQQYTHNINLLRFLLDGGDDAEVVSADLDEDGQTGVVVLRVGGVRCVLESGRLRYHRWDEHTQAYFDRGWVHTWAPPLLLRNAVAEVEIYRSEEPGRAGASGDAGLREMGVEHTITRALPEPRWSWAYKREAEHFLECVRSGAPFRSSAEDTRTDVRLFEEIYRRWITRGV